MFENIHHFHHFQQLACGYTGDPSCKYFNTAPSDTNGLWFGATHIQAYSDYSTSGGNANEVHTGKIWLNDSNSTTDYDTTQKFLLGSSHGMFSSSASINAFWSDTTFMDNLRGADITASTVAGSTETIGPNNPGTNVRGGHSVHYWSGETYYKSDATVDLLKTDGTVVGDGDSTSTYDRYITHNTSGFPTRGS